MGNRNTRSSASVSSPPARAPSGSPGTAAVMPPKLAEAHTHTRTPHPLDIYTLPTGLYPDRTALATRFGVSSTELRDLITSRRLAPRVRGLDDPPEDEPSQWVKPGDVTGGAAQHASGSTGSIADAGSPVAGTMQECPVCMLYYSPWALNTSACCCVCVCTECYMHTCLAALDSQTHGASDTRMRLGMMTLGSTLECPFCKRTGWRVTYSGDPSPLVHTHAHARAHGDASAAGTRSDAPAGVAAGVPPSPHLRSYDTERHASRARAPTMEQERAILASHGVAFASPDERTLIKKEVAAQEVDARRSLARDVAARKTPRTMFAVSSRGPPAGGTPSIRGAASPALYGDDSPYRTLTAAAAAPRSPLVLDAAASRSADRALTSVTLPESAYSAIIASSTRSRTGTDRLSDADDDMMSLAQMMASLRASVTAAASSAESRAAPRDNAASVETFLGSALRGLASLRSGVVAAPAPAPAPAAVVASSPRSGHRASATRARVDPDDRDAGWRASLRAGSLAAVTAGIDEVASTHAAALRALREAEHPAAPLTPPHVATYDSGGEDADALEEFMLAQAIAMSLAESQGASAAPVPSESAAPAGIASARAASAAAPSASASLRDVLLAPDEEERAPRRPSRRADAVSLDSSDTEDDDNDDDDDDDDDEAGEAPADARVRTDAALSTDDADSRRSRTVSDDEMLALAMHLSLADHARNA